MKKYIYIIIIYYILLIIIGFIMGLNQVTIAYFSYVLFSILDLILFYKIFKNYILLFILYIFITYILLLFIGNIIDLLRGVNLGEAIFNSINNILNSFFIYIKELLLFFIIFLLFKIIPCTLIIIYIKKTK